jgi:hypothetical protein
MRLFNIACGAAGHLSCSSKKGNRKNDAQVRRHINRGLTLGSRVCPRCIWYPCAARLAAAGCATHAPSSLFQPYLLVQAASYSTPPLVRQCSPRRLITLIDILCRRYILASHALVDGAMRLLPQAGLRLTSRSRTPCLVCDCSATLMGPRASATGTQGHRGVRRHRDTLRASPAAFAATSPGRISRRHRAIALVIAKLAS